MEGFFDDINFYKGWVLVLVGGQGADVCRFLGFKMDDVLIEKVRVFVEGESASSAQGKDPFYFHFVPVVKYSKMLGEKNGADLEVLEIAAWLHDIGSMKFGIVDHHITSCKVADEVLSELGYPREKIEKVKHCIFSHRGSQNIKRETIEAEILAEADALSHFDDFVGLFQAAFFHTNNDRREAKVFVKGKLQRSYCKLSSSAKDIIRPKFEAAMLLLD